MADVKVSAACAETNAIVTTRIEGWIE